MSRIKVVALDKKVKRSAKVLEKYYNTVSREQINRIKTNLFFSSKNLQQRNKAFAKHKNTILALKPIFKELVIERNRIGRGAGYKNFLEFALAKDGVPRKKFLRFLRKVDGVIKKINKNIPISKHVPGWYWSKSGILDPLYLINRKCEYTIPDDIYQIAKKIGPQIAEVLPKIKIVKEIKDFYPATRYDRKNQTVNIEVSSSTGIYNVLAFIHELGHAVEFFKGLRKNIEPSAKGKYWHEKKAIKFVFDFMHFAPKLIQNAILARTLLDFQAVLFEYEIYTDQEQNFAQVYASTINRCFLPSKQKKNPLYVLESYYVDRPCTVVSTSVAELAELEIILSQLDTIFPIPYD